MLTQCTDSDGDQSGHFVIFVDAGAASGVSWYHGRSCPIHSIRLSPHGSYQPTWLRADTTGADTAHIDQRVGPAGMVTPANGALRSGKTGRLDTRGQPLKEPAWKPIALRDTAPAGERLEEAASGSPAP